MGVHFLKHIILSLLFITLFKIAWLSRKTLFWSNTYVPYTLFSKQRLIVASSNLHVMYPLSSWSWLFCQINIYSLYSRLWTGFSKWCGSYFMVVPTVRRNFQPINCSLSLDSLTNSSVWWHWMCNWCIAGTKFHVYCNY